MLSWWSAICVIYVWMICRNTKFVVYKHCSATKCLEWFEFRWTTRKTEYFTSLDAIKSWYLLRRFHLLKCLYQNWFIYLLVYLLTKSKTNATLLVCVCHVSLIYRWLEPNIYRNVERMKLFHCENISLSGCGEKMIIVYDFYLKRTTFNQQRSFFLIIVEITNSVQFSTAHYTM